MKSTKSKPKVILHTGMHRSGTSLLAKGLTVLGVQMGKDFFPAYPDNVKGFFEDSNVVGLHKEILTALRADPNHGMTTFGKIDFSKRATSKAIGKLESLIITRCDEGGMWGLKDPRLCLLLPIWLQALARTDSQPVSIFSLRNPLDVALSLQKRNGLTIKQGLLIWLVYVYSFACNIGECPSLIVSYEKMMGDPIAELMRVSKFIGIDFDAEAKEVKEYVSSFVDRGLHHHQSTSTDLRKMAKDIPAITNAYKWLSRRAKSSELRPEDWDEFRKLLSGLDVAQEILTNLTMQDIQRLSGPLSLKTVLYFDTGEGFSEKNVLQQAVSSESGLVFFDLSSIPGIKSLRFDPCEDCCVLKIGDMSGTYCDGKTKTIVPSFTNALACEGDTFVFQTIDPQLYYDVDPKIQDVFFPFQVEGIGLSAMPRIAKELALKHTTAKEAFNELSASFKEQGARYDEMRAEFDAVIARKIELETQLNPVNDLVQSLTKESGLVRDENEALRVELQEITKKLETALDVAETARAVGESARAEIVMVRSQLIVANNKVSSAHVKEDEARSEAEAARIETEQARSEAEAARVETEQARSEAEAARVETEQARSEAESARVETEQARSEAEAACVETEQARSEAEAARIETEQARSEIESARIETEQARSEAEAACVETEQARSEAEAARIETEQARSEIESARIETEQARSEAENGWQSHADVLRSLGEIKAQLEAELQYIDNLKRSVSWRITAPLRFVLAVIVGTVKLLFALATFSPARLCKVLEDFRWSPIGGFIYPLLMPKFVKEALNRRWRKGTFQVASADWIPPAACGLRDGLSEEAKSAIQSPSIIKSIAFYLPQFHPIPENNEWWGEGFTEWTNVAKAQPMYPGHDHPKCPTTLGYYDLRLPEVMKKQAELAKEFGIYGFCFHHYDFSGRRILETPVDNFMENSDIDIPFCLCWANENWTRRWDGFDEDVLLAQDHSPEDDVRFIEAMAPYFADNRYIHKDGKPFFIVYKPEQNPNMAETLELWREHRRKTHGGELYIVMAQSFGAEDPRDYGFDAAVQFPPHKYTWDNPKLNDELATVGDYAGQIFEYEHFADYYASQDPEYTLFKTVSPAWDNTARRGVSGTIFANSSPSKYKKWLGLASKWTSSKHPFDSQFVFINAWNEWAEGAYLEPDRTYGHAYLNATSQVLAKYPEIGTLKDLSTGKILFVSHDACLGGAQKVLHSLLNWLVSRTSVEVNILCLSGGLFLEEFSLLGPTTTLEELERNARPGQTVADLVQEFCGGKPDLIYGNTVVVGRIYENLSNLEVPIITHVHELEESIRVYASDCIDDLIKYTTHFIACSPTVEDNLCSNRGVPQDMVSLICAHIDPVSEPPSAERKHLLRDRLGLPRDTKLIVGCGLGLFWRKGADLFVKVAKNAIEQSKEPLMFYWVGNFDPTQNHEEYGSWKDVEELLEREELSGVIQFVGQKSNAVEYIEAADIFVLPSREDPFPLVCLEAAERAVPIICFDEAGGMPSFVESKCGFVVPWGDTEAMARKICLLVEDIELLEMLGAQGREKLLAKHTIDQVGPAILERVRETSNFPPVLSVIVPNYNKSDYLIERLDSIFNQSYKDFEVILLDDCSTDGSHSTLELYSGRPNVSYIRNKKNAGVFSQWKQGIELAKGELIWIAEADDACAEDFLEKVLPAFVDEHVKISYSESQAIDADSKELFQYKDMSYLKELSEDKWATAYVVDAKQEVESALAYRNTIPNVSAVVFRRFDCTEWFDIANDMKLAGDWVFYLFAMRNGSVSYHAEPLNLHRRHDDTCTASTEHNVVRFNEVAMCQTLACSMYTVGEDSVFRCESFVRGIGKELGMSEGDMKKYMKKSRRTIHKRTKSFL